MRKFALPVALVFLAWFAGVSAQDDEKQGRLNLGADKATRGDQAFIPVVWSPPAGMAVRKIAAEMRFPRKSLVFEEARNSGTSDSSTLEVHAEVVAGEESAPNSVLRLCVESKANEAISSGAVAMLTFKVLDEAPVGQAVTLETRAEGFGVTEPTAAIPLLSNKGEIDIVQVPVVFACYFYMH